MTKNIYFLLFGFWLLMACNEGPKKEGATEELNVLLNQWHQAAAETNFEAYLGFMDADAVYIGTDATEYWDSTAFAQFCKPYFDKGHGWEFKALSRNIYLSDDGQTAWFDEVLDGHMGICRGSGVLTRKKQDWKLKQYVLSAAIPNEIMGELIQEKAIWDSTFKIK